MNLTISEVMLSRTNIQEANKHLHAMHQRIASLENTIQHQNQTLIDRDATYQTQFQRLNAAKEEETAKLQRKLTETERISKEKDSVLETHKQLLETKDHKIKDLEQKVDILGQILQFLPNLRSMVSVLDSVNLSEFQVNGDVENTQGNLRSNYPMTHSPKASSLAKHYVTNSRSRHFSISEDSDEDNQIRPVEENETNHKVNDTGVTESQGILQGKEYYL